MPSSFQRVVDAKREARTQALATAGPSSSEHVKYLNATGTCLLPYTTRLRVPLCLCVAESITAHQIVANIQKGEWKASQVLEAYIARAAFAHERTNCLTESAHISQHCKHGVA